MGIIRYLGVFLICIFLSSCAHSYLKYRPKDIKKIFNQKADLYQNKDREKFFGYISQERYPNYDEFKNQIEDFLYSHSNINLEFRIEKILTSGNAESVEVKWFKTYVDTAGSPIKREGFAIFFFDVSNHELSLINIKGDNPYTQ